MSKQACVRSGYSGPERTEAVFRLYIAVFCIRVPTTDSDKNVLSNYFKYWRFVSYFIAGNVGLLGMFLKLRNGI